MDILDILLLFFFLLALGLTGGVLYLIYLPFKRRLIKSGKLTPKLNRQINWIIVLLVCFIGAILHSHKDDRTPSAEILERTSDVRLPAKFKILKDEYHDMMQDYCIYYDIQFDKNASAEFSKSIKTSKFYNITVGPEKGLWAKSSKGYDFTSKRCNIKYDTITNILKYEECG